MQVCATLIPTLILFGHVSAPLCLLFSRFCTDASHVDTHSQEDMGSTTSRGPDTAPALNEDAVQRLCKEAYACGIEDGSMAAQAQVESTCRQVMYGAGLLILSTAWLSFTWSTSRMRAATVAASAAKKECDALRAALQKAEEVIKATPK